jgi:hypothetical protein
MSKNDPFEAKWTIIAKAYSSIRDVVRKQRASLATFLALVCSKLSIINVKNYFRKKWTFETTVNSTKVLKQNSFLDHRHFEGDTLHTNITPKDILQFGHRWVTFHSELPMKLQARTTSTQLDLLQEIKNTSRAYWPLAQLSRSSTSQALYSEEEVSAVQILFQS